MIVDRVPKWTTVQLGEIAEFRNGVNYTKDNFGSGIKVINVKDFQDHLIPRIDELDEINPEGIVKDRDLLKNGDLLFVRSNGNRDLIGRSLYISGVEEHLAHSAFTIRVRFTDQCAHPRFYAYLLRSRLIRDVLSSHGGGTNISNLNQGILRSLEIPFPPLEEQIRIASILSAYDDLIENNRRRIEILEGMARNIYREWFVHFRFPGHENTQFVDSPLGPIPEGWEVKAVGEVVETLGGGTPSKKEPAYWDAGDITWYSPSDLTAIGSMFMEDSTNHITELGLQKSSARMFPANSVMMTSRATIGVVSINVTPACTNQGFITCIPNEQLSTYHLYFWLLENKELITSLASGATFKEINKKTFREINIAVPTGCTAHHFKDAVAPIGDQISNLLKRNGVLGQTRDLLLPKLVSGEVTDCRVEEGVKG